MSGVFDAYARYYDLLYRDKDYAAEAEYVASLIHQHAPEAKSILELGCGTSAHAEHFARMGYTVVGIDISDAMLARAEERQAVLSAELVRRLSFEPGDIRTWRTDKTFDVVVSLFHVFSYQTANEDLQAAFETAAVHLKPGGILIFDFWYGPAVLSQQPEIRVKRLENEYISVMRITEPEIYPLENRVRVNYFMLIDSKDNGTSERVSESHDMHYLFIPEIKQTNAPWFFEGIHLARMSSRSPDLNDWAGVSILERNQ